MSSDHDNWARAANNKRNLAFLLLDLSEFVVKMDVCPELSYLLLKQAFLLLKVAIEEWIRRGCDSK